ncbi:DUF1810 family protein [Bradyrhizobium pachyrhizi]|uniref:DUF1810 family protein n=1 Tax=Bradyrhizobium pachyrhizi TaxID=280333 RepID=A0A844T0R2_9BRAD|nr:DUF1810 family protein [Bradyrhizobium pachyrhizi]
MSDPFELQRFVDAQEPVYRRVVQKLSRGRKTSHWMWFIFPQMAGLGFSTMAQRFPIGSHAEAAAYLRHEVLGPRLTECTRLVLAASDRSITEILGSPDDLKFRSSMTLFDAVSTQTIFGEAIAAFYKDGRIPRGCRSLSEARLVAPTKPLAFQACGLLSWMPTEDPPVRSSTNAA